MPDWREKILNQFQPKVARLTLVADPDSLLLEEQVLTAIRERGFDIIPFEDGVEFRYAYETQYRGKWDRNEETDLVVVLRAPLDDLQNLPYDLLRAGRQLSFSLHEVFPKLSYPVVDRLHRSLLDPLYEAYVDYDGAELGDRATKDFVLKSVFKIVPEMTTSPADFLKALLSVHYRNMEIPLAIKHHLIERLKKKELFATWPLEEIIGDRHRFYSFLQKQWQAYLLRAAGGPSEVREEGKRYAAEELDVPFEHHDVRAYLDNLFIEGHLKPVGFPEHEKLPGWARVGIVIDPEAEQLERLEGLLGALERGLPNSDSSYREWLNAAGHWADVCLISCQVRQTLPPGLGERMRSVREKLDTLFENWMRERYPSILNVPYLPKPVMVHHIAPYLAHYWRTNHRKLALVVIDGLSLCQWLIVRDQLQVRLPTIRVVDEPIFSSVPTLTAVSRQAIFAGKIPLYFSGSVTSTEKEEIHWLRFWQEVGLSPADIGYRRGLGNEAVNDRWGESVVEERVVVGVVIDKVDKIIHGMQLGSVGMIESVRLWAEEGYLEKVVQRLMEKKFDVFITSDHGNVESVGQGVPHEGCLVESHGMRSRLYDDPRVRDEVRRQFSETICWDGGGLPTGLYALLAQGRTAFAMRESRVVSHGGITIEEVIVPFATVCPEE